jgi:hypothetical protein
MLTTEQPFASNEEFCSLHLLMHIHIGSDFTSILDMYMYYSVPRMSRDCFLVYSATTATCTGYVTLNRTTAYGWYV